MSSKKPFNLDMFRGSIANAMASAGATRTDIYDVPIDLIKVKDGFNVRIKDKDYHEQVRLIADSIKINGFYRDKPLAVYVADEGDDDVLYVTDGHTRLDAVKLAVQEGNAIEKIPVMFKLKGTSMEDLTVALITSNNGRQLKPMETAEVCKRLHHYGWTIETIASKIGLTKQYIDSLLSLMEATTAIRNMVNKGHVSSTMAINVIQEHKCNAESVLRDAIDRAKVEGSDRASKRHLLTERKERKKTKKEKSVKELKADFFDRALVFIDAQDDVASIDTMIKLIAFEHSIDYSKIKVDLQKMKEAKLQNTQETLS